MLVEMDGRVFVVGRSRTPVMDVVRGARSSSAAAVTLPPPRRSSATVISTTCGRGAGRACPAGVTSGARARDIMSAPAWFIDHQVTVEQAMAECRRRQTSGVQVEADGVLVGAVAREDLDRAFGHRLGHAPVRAVMTSRGRHDRSRRDPDRGAARDREGAGRSGGGGHGCRTVATRLRPTSGGGHSHRPAGRPQPAARRSRQRAPRPRWARPCAAASSSRPCGRRCGSRRRRRRRLPGGWSGAGSAAGSPQLRHRSGCGGRRHRLRGGARCASWAGACTPTSAFTPRW